MKIYEEKDIRQFEFWSGAAGRADLLTAEDWDTVESELEAMYPDGMSDTELNDLFWFEFDTIARMLGYEDEEDMTTKRDPGYVDDEGLEDHVVPWFLKTIKDVYNKHGVEALEEIAGIFGFDTDDAVDQYRFSHDLDEDEEISEVEALKSVLESQTADPSQLFTDLFNNDNGNWYSNHIPTLEGFRSEVMAI